MRRRDGVVAALSAAGICLGVVVPVGIASATVPATTPTTTTTTTTVAGSTTTVESSTTTSTDVTSTDVTSTDVTSTDVAVGPAPLPPVIPGIDVAGPTSLAPTGGGGPLLPETGDGDVVPIVVIASLALSVGWFLRCRSGHHVRPRHES